LPGCFTQRRECRSERGGGESDDRPDERGAIADQPDSEAGNESSERGHRAVDRASGGVRPAEKLVRRECLPVAHLVRVLYARGEPLEGQRNEQKDIADRG
jgi:hypothetical protein